VESRARIEYDLLRWGERSGLPIMAYSPIERGRDPLLRSVAARHLATPAQVALARVLRKDNVCAIPRASNPAHVRENRVALDMHLSTADFASWTARFRLLPTNSRSRCTKAARSNPRATNW
jgi:diketogulonate reductase-like aldo/keto reductase